MTLFTKLGTEINAPVDSTGAPRGAAMIDEMIWKTEVETVVDAFVSNGGLIYDTKTSLTADLAHPANTQAWVVADSTAANNGIYRKSGASGSGSWSRVADLPYSFSRLANAGAGAANAIAADSGVPVPTAPYGALLLLNITADNTGDVTLSINGGTAKPVLTNAGNQIAPGGFLAGMVATLVDTGANYRLTSDQTSASVLAAAESAKTDAEAAAAVAAGAMTTVIDPQFATVATAEAYSPDAAPTYIRTAFYDSTQVPGSGQTYKQVGSEPSHANKLSIQVVGDAQRTWYVGAARIVDCTALGTLPGLGVMDTQMANAIAAGAASPAKALRIPNGTYAFTKQVDFSALEKVELGGEVVFDFTGATAAADFVLGGHVNVIAPALTPLPDLQSDVVKGANTLTFLSNPGLSHGDRFCIYNPTDFSWHGSRSYYRAGEWCQVADGSGGATVDLQGSLYAAYAAVDVDIYKHPNKRFEMAGGTLTILESADPAMNGKAGFRAERIVDSDFSAIRPTNSGYGGILTIQCIGISGPGYKVNQHRITSGGVYYGWVNANGQDMDPSGRFHGGRHGWTNGGIDAIGAVPCRNCYPRGMFTNSADAGAGIGAANCHANSEYCGFEGMMDGGFSGGGDHIRCRGTIRSKAAQTGVAIYLSEMVGCSFDFDGCNVWSDGATQTITRGVIDCGGNSTGALDANTRRGGHLNFDNMLIEGKRTTRLFMIRNRGYVGAEPIIISARNSGWPSTVAGGPIAFLIDAPIGNPIDELWLHGFRNGPKATYSVASVGKIKGWRDSGKVTLTPSTSASVVTAGIVFSEPAPRVPEIVPALKGASTGGKRVSVYYDNPSTTGATIGIATSGDPAPLFASAASSEVSWEAVIG